MKVIRNISLVCFAIFIFSVSAEAQIGKKKIILASGDTTLLVNPVSNGLRGEDSKFLNKDRRFNDQQVFVELKTDYSSLEEAALDTNALLEKIVKAQANGVDGNESLSFRASQVNRMKEIKEKQVQSIVDSMLVSDASAEEIAKKYLEFGNQPAYYINEQRVDPSVPDLLRPKEVLSRMVKVTNVISGNPNGEVWYEVTPEAIQRLKLANVMLEPTTIIIEENIIDETGASNSN